MQICLLLQSPKCIESGPSKSTQIHLHIIKYSFLIGKLWLFRKKNVDLPCIIESPVIASKNSSEALRFERHFPSQLQQNILHGPVAWHPRSKPPPRRQHKASEPLGCNSMTIAMMKAAKIALFIPIRKYYSW